MRKPWETETKILINAAILHPDHRRTISVIFENHPVLDRFQTTGTTWAERCADNPLAWRLYSCV